VTSAAPPGRLPGAGAEWFAYLWENPVVGLLNLDLAMEIGLDASIPLYLALYAALRPTDRSLMPLATAVALTSVLLHILSNSALWPSGSSGSLGPPSGSSGSLGPPSAQGSGRRA
jgi:hypothetical protein